MYHCYSHQFWISDFSVFSVTMVLNQSNNYINFDLQYRSTPTLEATQFPLHEIIEHQPSEKYQESDNRGDIDIKSNVNRLDPGKIRQSTSLYIQNDWFYQPSTWRPLYFYWWYHFENCPGIVYPIKCMQKSLQNSSQL